MENDIVNFLPSYPNIDVEKEDILNTYDDFYKSIYEKKEFYEQKISKDDKISYEKGKLQKNQEFISRFLSSNTPYNELLVFHEMGVGKSIASIGAIERIKKEDNNFDGALILAKGTSLLDNYKREIKKYTSDYDPAIEYDDKDKEFRVFNYKLKSFYNFKTFYTMAKILNTSEKNNIIKTFSNKIIIIDEVHNIRDINEEDEHDIWYEYEYNKLEKQVLLEEEMYPKYYNPFQKK